MTGTAETEAGEFWDIYKLDVSLRVALRRPEAVVFAPHPFDELRRRNRPIEFVGVGDEHGKERHRI